MGNKFITKNPKTNWPNKSGMMNEVTIGFVSLIIKLTGHENFIPCNMSVNIPPNAAAKYTKEMQTKLIVKLYYFSVVILCEKFTSSIKGSNFGRNIFLKF